jgi:hypothetical protein
VYRTSHFVEIGRLHKLALLTKIGVNERNSDLSPVGLDM